MKQNGKTEEKRKEDRKAITQVSLIDRGMQECENARLEKRKKERNQVKKHARKQQGRKLDTK